MNARRFNEERCLRVTLILKKKIKPIVSYKDNSKICHKLEYCYPRIFFHGN